MAKDIEVTPPSPPPLFLYEDNMLHTFPARIMSVFFAPARKGVLSPYLLQLRDYYYRTMPLEWHKISFLQITVINCRFTLSFLDRNTALYVRILGNFSLLNITNSPVCYCISSESRKIKKKY
jgi:hypothetical protein